MAVDFTAWLNDPAAVRIVLVEVGVKSGGLETTRFLSTGAYTTSSSDSPANQYYDPVITTGIKFTEQLDLQGQGNLSVGDIEIANYNGERDDWLDDVWDNRSVKAWIGDPRWIRSDFQMIFNGVVATIGSRGRDVLNLSLRDKLQRLNTPATDVKVGGSDPTSDDVLCLSFGEVHNVTPQVTNATTLEYQVHDGAIEGCFEVRDNGKPVAATHNFATGRFTLNRSPAGTITASVQGDKFGGTYRTTIASLVRRIVTGYGKISDRFGATTPLPAGEYNIGVPALESFTRASTATYIGIDGRMKTAAINEPRIDYSTGTWKLLVENADTNFCEFSEHFTTTAWAKTRSTVMQNPISAPLAPNDTRSMDKLVVDKTAATTHSILQSSIGSFQIGDMVYLSIYAAPAEHTQLYLQINSTGAAFGGSRGAKFDLLTGVVSNKSASIVDSGSRNMGNGVWHCWVASVADGVGTAAAAIFVASPTGTGATGITLATANGVDGIYIWGCSMTKGKSSYIPSTDAFVSRASTGRYVNSAGLIVAASTNVARIEYDQNTLHLKGLLREVSAVNSVTYSEQFQQSAWPKARSNITADAMMAPSGAVTADKLTEDATLADNHGIVRSYSAAASTTYTWSIFVKAGERTFTRIQWGGFANQVASVILTVNLLTGEFTSTDPSRTTVEMFPNGWWRLSATTTSIASAVTISPSIYIAESLGSITYDGDNTSGIYIWGGQVEIGSFPTSYIFTTTASVTRSADVTTSVPGVRAADFANMYDDIDLANFTAFDIANTQPVSVYADGRTNVLTMCQELASSIGAQLVMSRLGKLRLIQLSIPGTGTPVQIDSTQMVERSIRVASRPLVKGSVMLGFNRNYTVQAGLLTSIPELHKSLLTSEWLTTTKKDTEVIDAYKLNEAPIQSNTALIAKVHADVEAQRRLDLWKVPRSVIQFEGTADLLQTLELGVAATITHPRFGLSAGKTGIVISLAPDWLTGRVSVGVLV